MNFNVETENALIKTTRLAMFDMVVKHLDVQNRLLLASIFDGSLGTTLECVLAGWSSPNIINTAYISHKLVTTGLRDKLPEDVLIKLLQLLCEASIKLTENSQRVCHSERLAGDVTSAAAKFKKVIRPDLCGDSKGVWISTAEKPAYVKAVQVLCMHGFKNDFDTSDEILSVCFNTSRECSVEYMVLHHGLRVTSAHVIYDAVEIAREVSI